jgi:hypothetical protein
MITKEQCIENTTVVVNNKITKWNSIMGAEDRGLICFPFSKEGQIVGEEKEIPVGTKLIILSTPKRFNGNGNQVKFKLKNNKTILSAWWASFKHKVNLI